MDTPPQANVPPTAENDVHENKDIAALSYVWILSLVVFFAKRHSPFIRFHARQGIVLFVASILVWMIPVVGRLLELIVLAFCVFGFLSAAQGHWKELPLIFAVSKGDWKGVRSAWQSLVQMIVDFWHGIRHSKASSETPVASTPQPGAESQPPPSTPLQ